MPRLSAPGGFDAKGPACFLLEMEGRRLLLDLGTGPDAGRRPRLDGIGRIDAVLISHGHADHIGALDALPALGNPPLHATAPVRALARTPALATAHDLPRRGKVAGLPVETGLAAHAPGAVWMRIGGPGGLLYSGDFTRGSALYRAEPMPPARAAVLDGSYGLRDETLATQAPALIAVIGGGPCLLPAPADGRALELALAAHAAGLPVSLCPDVRRVGRALTGMAGWLAPGAAEALAALLDAAGELDGDSPLHGVMIAAGANCGSGLSERLAPRALAAAVPVIPTGHLSQGAPTTRWVAEGRARVMGWNVHPDRHTLAAALAAISPAVALAAFAPPEPRRAIAAAFPGVAWSDNGVLEW